MVPPSVPSAIFAQTAPQTSFPPLSRDSISSHPVGGVSRVTVFMSFIDIMLSNKSPEATVAGMETLNVEEAVPNGVVVTLASEGKSPPALPSPLLSLRHR